LNEKILLSQEKLSQLRGFFLLILDCKLTTVIPCRKFKELTTVAEMLKNIEMIRFLYPVIGKYESYLKEMVPHNYKQLGYLKMRLCCRNGVLDRNKIMVG
jgi:hypothetical protein